ncbi:MAG: GNAT family N-acetyltransferase [Anaerolineales bacterium]|nr:GNAT family N-acetyltransferase [Anaerolineae bacterium]PWB50610.1 MAG: GNAT family N-acetyltransferase [Anaerolineales bacterium]
MDDEYRIEYLQEPAWEIIGGGLANYNNQEAGNGHGRSLCFALFGPDQTILGGVIGETHWDWLFINLMWLPEALRGQGFGWQLLRAAEEEGRKRGATHAYLDTFSFQAPEFYKKNGYQVFGTLEDFPPGHQRYYLVKKL